MVEKKKKSNKKTENLEVLFGTSIRLKKGGLTCLFTFQHPFFPSKIRTSRLDGNLTVIPPYHEIILRHEQMEAKIKKDGMPIIN